jgi:hypothetical protein
MAMKQFYIGSLGPFLHDDSTHPVAFNSEAPITIGPGIDSDHAARIGDISDHTLLWPVNSIYTNMSNVDPGTELGFGTWVSLGTLTIGTTVTYHWKRTV